MPDNGKRYEIIDGELLVSKQPHYSHQRVCSNLAFVFESWDRQTGKGEVTVAPGLISPMMMTLLQTLCGSAMPV